MNRSPRQTSRKPLTAPIRKVRFAWVAIFFCAWVALIAGRLSWLQVVRHSDWEDKAERQQQRTFSVAPRRGVLYDRNLRQLAMTVLVDSIYAVPSELGENRGEAAAMLAKVVHNDPADNFTAEPQMLSRFNASRNFAWVARRVDATIAARVRELNLKGVYFQKEFKRFYPNSDLAAQVLGYVGTDDTGLGGLEQQFDDEMHGAPGRKLTAVDAKSHILRSFESDPLPGEDLVLSIDANIQYIAERALDEQMAKMKALHGTVVVQDPHTGQILALAVSPRFNPNDSRHMDASVLTDLAVSDVYEPGSTFKLVTYAAALDAAGVEPTDKVDCQGGAMTMYGRTLHDDKSDHYGVVTVQQALEHSSDVGAAKMALKLGPQKFYEYIKGFGFGDRSGIELPSETRGLLQSPRRWSATSILSLAIGQEVGVTPVQLVSMVSAIANGGVYIPPRILLESAGTGSDGRLQPAAFHPENQLPARLPEGSHRVIKELTSGKMRMMMEGIVTEGTGKLAALNGYSSAGKTGTAQKIDPETRTYSHTKHVASFAGFAPVSNPAIAVAVVIDTPTAGGEAMQYGGATSAPVFAEVAQQVLEYLGVPHDRPLKTKQQLLASSHLETADDLPSENIGDLETMFAAVNNLPADDPLHRAAGSAPATSRAEDDGPALGAGKVIAKANGASGSADGASGSANASRASRVFDLLPAKVLAAFAASRANGLAQPAAAAGDPNQSRALGTAEESSAPPAPEIPPQIRAQGARTIVVDAGQRVAVPAFTGSALRTAVETAAALGLRVEPVGSGIAREQAPAAGTMVPIGTQVVVRFAR